MPELRRYYNRSGAEAKVRLNDQMRGQRIEVVPPLGYIDSDLSPAAMAGKCPQLSLEKPPAPPTDAPAGAPTVYDVEQAKKARRARVTQYSELSDGDLRDICKMVGIEVKEALAQRRLEIAAETGETDPKKLKKAADKVKVAVGAGLAEALVRFEEKGSAQKVAVEEARREVALRVGGRQDMEIAVVDEPEE